MDKNPLSWGVSVHSFVVSCVLQKNISQWQQIKNRILAVAMSNNQQYILIATYCSIVDWDGGVWWRWLGVHWQFTVSFPCDTELLPSHRPLGSLDSTSGLTSSPSGKELKWCGSYHLLWLGCRGSELPLPGSLIYHVPALDFCLSEKWVFSSQVFCLLTLGFHGLTPMKNSQFFSLS